MKIYSFCVLLCSFVLVAPVSTFAETHVTSLDTGGPVWTEANSPYVIDDYLYFNQANPLTIEPGVSIVGGSDSNVNIIFAGSSTIAGTPTKPITFSNLSLVEVLNGTSTIQNVSFDHAPFELQIATATMDHVTFANADKAIIVRRGNLNASNISIASSTYGVYSQYARPVLMYSNSIFDRITSIWSNFIGKKVMAQAADDPWQSHVTINNSSFEDTKYGVYNETMNVVHAENNWWGSDAGPSTSANASTSMIYGPVSYTPWTGRATSTPSCCSSVLFIPGLEASRLVRNTRLGLSTTTVKLWEPMDNLNVRELFLDSAGRSIQPNIHPNGLLDNALGFMPIYQKFIQTMNGLVSAGTIAEWKAYPYDWRMSLTDVSRGSIGTSSVIKTIESMASTSKTGKVTIIAHSNGGLVTKLVYNALRDRGQANLVDKIIFVAVPELGTPQAVASLLHGDSEEIAGGIVLSKSTARQLGVNMPSAYSLLPSMGYFDLVPQTIMSFASSTLAGLNFSKYFPTITTYSGMKSFITDKSHGQVSESVNIPVTGNARFFPQAESVHSVLDNWQPASSTQLVAIAGWGLPTLTGIEYFEKFVCQSISLFGLVKNCGNELKYNKKADSGDGTVVFQSATYSPSTKQLFDISGYNKDNHTNLAHADILQANQVEQKIKQDIGAASSSAEISYFSSSIPADYKFPPNLVIDVYSPVDINVYDSYGNHTGPIPSPVPGSDLTFYEEKIPGSYYDVTGAGVEVTLPVDPTLQINLDGTGIGGVAVDTRITDMNNHGETVASSSFDGMIVTPITHMELTVGTTSNADPYQMIKIDENGDGIFDATATPGVMPNITPEMYRQSLADSIRVLKLDPRDERRFLDRLDKAWKSGERNKNSKSDKDDKTWQKLLDKRVRHINRKNVSDQNRREMSEFVNEMLDDAGV
ncbi:MAG: hypothetical protein KGJ35_00595 [Patescibacteria group bacterium]|nr:hypothetical protein [Patescibacteria group bacterium]